MFHTDSTESGRPPRLHVGDQAPQSLPAAGEGASSRPCHGEAGVAGGDVPDGVAGRPRRRGMPCVQSGPDAYGTSGAREAPARTCRRAGAGSDRSVPGYGIASTCAPTAFDHALPAVASQLVDQVIAPRRPGYVFEGLKEPQLVALVRQSRAALTTDGET